MWEFACEKLSSSVHAVLLETPEGENQNRLFQTIGTAFTIRHGPSPLLITNAHVALDPDAKPYPGKLLTVAAFLPNKTRVVAGAAVRYFSLKYDLAILEASANADDMTPVEFYPTDKIETGKPIAALGFPIPPLPESSSGKGSLLITRRFSAGFLSQDDTPGDFGDKESKELHYQEINLLSYPGNSGSPAFDIAGRVIGMIRGAIKFEEKVAAYAYVIPAKYIRDFLASNHIPFK
jgi:S1-C subfamily serine protease